MSKKFVYLFSEGDGSMRELLGGKGANLAEMTKLGLPVPQGFTISTEACTQYYDDGKVINDSIQAEIMEYITKMEEITGKKFGDKENPLLVSVRSGARASMPGMMDTILNLGLNEDVVEVLAKKSGNPRWAYDCYRRFIQMYSDVVMEVGKKYFEELIDKMKEEKGITQDVDLTADDLKELAGQFKAEYKSKIMDFDAKLGYKYYFNNGYIKPYFGLGVTKVDEGKIEKIGASETSKSGMNASIGILGQVIFGKFDLYGNIEYEYRFNKDSYHSKRDFSSLYEIAPLNYSRGVVNLETGINYKINDRFKINMGYGLRETKNGMLKLGFETQF